jgi:FdhE protein
MSDDQQPDLQPDPLLIGGVPKPPLALLPDPVALFQGRARRFAFLAQDHELAPYLRFLAELSRLQARLAATLAPIEPIPIPTDSRARAAQAHMPPIDRHALGGDPALAATLQALLDGAAALEMPDAARAALDAVLLADAVDRRWLLDNVLGDDIPADSVAPHLFAAAAVQVHLARLAAGLDADALVPVATGVCPACGGHPVTSSVMGMQGIENVRYACCAGCATQWNEVRVKCLCCGSTRGLSYRSVGTDEATVKAESCRECNAWMKIFYKVKNESLDPVADDVGSLGLDILMGDAGVRRGGFNPFLVGY